MCGNFDDGRTAVIENGFGQGRTLLIGSNPGIAYFRESNVDNLRYFSDVFAWTGRRQQVLLSNPVMQARLHESDAGRVLWVLNPTRQTQSAGVELAEQTARFGEPYWCNPGAATCGGEITVPPRDALILRLS